MKLKWIKFLFIAIAIIYFILPWDLIPDLLGIIGRIDDLLLPLFLLWRYLQLVDKYKRATEFYREKLAGYTNRADSSQTEAESFNPYKILEIEQHASSAEIDKAYREMLKLYHPDRTAHLGKDLQALAHQKTLDIQKAYQVLKGKK